MNFIPTSRETPRQTRRVCLPKLTTICGSTPCYVLRTTWPYPGTQVHYASQARLRVALCSYVRSGTR
jgi:hypothetical protein